LAGGLNLYGFAGGDPVNFADPFGLCSEEQSKSGGCPQKADVADQQKRTWVNPTGGAVRGCDKQGCGNFGAPRGDRTHAGADYVARTGQDVGAVTGGEVTNVGYPYGDDLSFRYVEITAGDGYVARQFYIQPGANVQTGASVQAGQVLGTQQRLRGRYPGIAEHVHVEIRRSGRLIDPTTLIPNPVP
jgi:murein DD-endopeptidase MepM/ murein hydrolase activator NlpD